MMSLSYVIIVIIDKCAKELNVEIKNDADD